MNDTRPLKITYVVSQFPTPYHTFILHDMLRLKEAGHQVDVVGYRRPEEAILERSTRVFADRTFYLAEEPGARGVLRFGIRVANRLRRVNDRLYRALAGFILRGFGSRIDARRYFQEVGWEVFSFPALAARVEARKPDLIHAAFGNRSATMAMMLSQLTGVPFTFEAHAYDLFVDFAHAEAKLKQASRMFTISQYNRDYLSRTLGGDPAKIVVKPYPFNRKVCDRLVGRPRKPNRVVSVCRLHPIKGLEFALDAFAGLQASHPELRYTIIGDGELEAALRKRIEVLGLQGKVEMLGGMNNETALEHVAEATLFMLPSVIAADGDREGIPTAVIEAMYLGTPVVSSRVVGIPEIISDGNNGMLAAPGDAAEIAEKVDRLLQNEDLRSVLGRNARETVLDQFNPERSTGKLVETWREILGHGRNCPRRHRTLRRF